MSKLFVVSSKLTAAFSPSWKDFRNCKKVGGYSLMFKTNYNPDLLTLAIVFVQLLRPYEAWIFFYLYVCMYICEKQMLNVLQNDSAFS